MHKPKAHIFRKEDVTRLEYKDPSRTVYIWLDSSVGAKHLDFGTVDLSPGEHTPDHVHAVAEEIMWVHRGKGVFIIEGEEFPVEEGMMVFAPPGVRHYGLNNGNEVMTIAFVYSPPSTEAQFQMRDKKKR